MREERLLLAGEWRDSDLIAPVHDPHDESLVARVAQADGPAAREAVDAAQRGMEVMRRLPVWRRAEILRGVAEGIGARAEELAELIREEVGKPIDLARGEVQRAIHTFTLGAEEVRRWGGEILPVDLQARTEGYRCHVQRFPRGPVLAIAPFNFPLNLVAHKLSPAFAVGSTVLLKPPPQGPSAALRLGEICLEAGLPEAALSVLPCSVDVAQSLVEDPGLEMVSFTGSARVGWMLKGVAGKKRVALELGGNAAAVVHEDADLEWAATRVALGAFAYAGQVCISAQRIFVQEAIAEPFMELLQAAVERLGVGDPRRTGVMVGPLIDGDAADRVEAWVQEALEAGATRVVGGKREGNVVWPTILEDVPGGIRVSCEEVFGPVAVVDRYSSFDQALDRVNDSVYGLQAAVFTRDIGRIYRAYEELEVGGLVINDYPMLRVDNFPYGGVKDSGFGREGVRYAMEEMSEPRVLLLRS
jgi:glyceraldehyde-3-phosphate dehydrogenase (NADP+)